jgi:hypothetical protein
MPVVSLAQSGFVNTGGLYNNGGLQNSSNLTNSSNILNTTDQTSTANTGGVYNKTDTTATANTSGLYNTGTAAQLPSTNACNTTIHTFGDLFTIGACIINHFLIGIALSFALIYFMWGVVQYVLSADSAEERKKSKQVMLWGVFALFIVVSMWGIIAFARKTLGI